MLKFPPSAFWQTPSYSVCIPSFSPGYIPSAGIPLQKQLEHANQQSGFTDSVSRVGQEEHSLN